MHIYSANGNNILAMISDKRSADSVSDTVYPIDPKKKEGSVLKREKSVKVPVYAVVRLASHRVVRLPVRVVRQYGYDVRNV